MSGKIKILSKKDIEEFKKLKKWVQECPIEAAMEIEELRIENARLKRVVYEVKNTVANDVFAVLSKATYEKGEEE